MRLPAKLVWQCRRGCKELDLLLQRYLETQYQYAGEIEKNRFVALLQLEDDELSALLLQPIDQQNAYYGLVQKIVPFGEK